MSYFGSFNLAEALAQSNAIKAAKIKKKQNKGKSKKAKKAKKTREVAEAKRKWKEISHPSIQGIWVDFGQFNWMLDPQMMDGYAQLPPLPISVIEIILESANFERVYRLVDGLRVWNFFPALDLKEVKKVNAAHVARYGTMTRYRGAPTRREDHGYDCYCDRCYGSDYDRGDCRDYGDCGSYFDSDEDFDKLEFEKWDHERPLSSKELDALDSYGVDADEDEMDREYQRFLATFDEGE